MPRFFKEFFDSDPVITGDDAKHIIKSLRMKKGEALTVCDTKGFDYSCIIKDLSGEQVFLEIIEKKPTQTEPKLYVTLYQCLTKGDKMDTIVKQAVEMGVSRIVPVISQNCVSRPDAATLNKKQVRWQKIANEAAGQCGRGILPLVSPCVSLNLAAEEMSKDDLSLFFYELGGKPVGTISKDINSVSVIIGPEGGFTTLEAETLILAGAVATTLGPRILRAETAPVAAVAVIMLQSGNMC